MCTLIEIRNLVKTYKTKKHTVVGVDNVSVTIQKGEIFGIVGYSGAGKSSLIRCLNLLETPTSGEIIIDGQDFTKLTPKGLRLARQKTSMIFQHFHLIKSKTVFDNLAFALKAAHVPKAEIKPRVVELLEMVGLSDRSEEHTSELQSHS